MKLSQLAEKSGYSVSTIYDYLRSGILHPPLKDGPTRSVFDRTHLERLNRIRALKRKKLSLKEIRKMITVDDEQSTQTVDSIRLQIVEKALELFSRQHYENTKISDITDALNMGSGTIYRYFKSKEELLLACLERLPAALVPRKAWDEVQNRTDILGRLKMRGYAMFNAFPSYTGMLDYAKLSLGSDNKNLALKAAECIESLVAPLKRDLDQFMNEGTVRELDSELVAYLLLGINETFFHRLLIDSRYSIDEGFAIIEDFIGHAIAAKSETRKQRENESTRFMLTDTRGNQVALNKLCFDGKPEFIGKFLEGSLRLFCEDLAEIRFELSGECVFADVTNRSGKQVRLEPEPNVQISGESDVGDFRIMIKRVNRLLREEEY